MPLTKRDTARLARLFSEGGPRYVRIYDNGGDTADRYTVVFNGKYRTLGRGRNATAPLGPIHVLTMSGAPTHPQGVCQHTEWARFEDAPEGWTTPLGRKNYLGRRIPFWDLPKPCRDIVMSDYVDIWQLGGVNEVWDNYHEAEKKREGQADGD